MKRLLLYYSSVSANLGLLSTGLFFGWLSPSLLQYKLPDSPIPSISPSEESSIASCLTLGAAFGCIVSAILSNKIGRKWTMLSSVIPAVIGWVIIIYATKPWMLYISRIVSGFAVATGFCTTPIYISETSPPKIRGTLLTGVQLASKLGILIEYSYGPFLNVKLAAFISLLFSILFGLTFMFVPETPYYLIRKGNKIEANKSLSRLRGKKDVTEELRYIEKSVASELENNGGLSEIIQIPGNRKALSISLTLIIIQQTTGAHAVISYAQEIFDQIFDDGSAPIEGKYLVIIYGGVTVLSAVFCGFLVDRIGRKPLLLISSTGCGLTMSLLAIFFYLKHNTNYCVSGGYFDWIPVTSVMLFAVTFAIGLAPIPFVASGELFPTRVKELGCGIATCMFFTASAIVTKTYKIIEIDIGLFAAFTMYAVCSFFGTIYILFFVPETRLKSLAEIQDLLNGFKK